MRIGRITSITVQHDRDPNNEQKLGTYSVVLEGEGFIETPAECCHRLKAESVARAIWEACERYPSFHIDRWS